jgi:ATP-dependent helicase HrpB
MTHRRLEPFDRPEVARTDVSRACLAIMSWGGDPRTFGWFERPDDQRLEAALTLLDQLGATADGRVTSLGQALQRLPLPPRAAAVLALAPPDLRDEALLVAALLSESADVPGRRTATLHDLMIAYQSRQLDAITTRAVKVARDALSRIKLEPLQTDVDSLEELVLRAHPDRVCRRRSPEAATLVDGGGIRIADPSAFRGDWFVALDARRGSFARHQEADVRLVCPIKVEWLATTTHQSAELTGGRVIAVRQVRYGDLILSEQRGGPVDPEAAQRLLHDEIERRGPDTIIDADDTLGPLYRRALFVAPAGELLPDAAQLLHDAAAGATTWTDVLRNARAMAQATIFSDPDRRLDQWAPTVVQVPSGSKVKLDWTEASYVPEDGGGEEHVTPPVLAVRLQELFGLAETPRVGPPPGIPVTLQLLAPNDRPQQATDDLASFWKNTYPQVRKDLRARYPKHSWPENPLDAQPLRGTKRQGR